MNIEKHSSKILETILNSKPEFPKTIAIVGQPATGKTFLSDVLGNKLRDAGYPVMRIKVQDNYALPIYHNPHLIRDLLKKRNRKEAKKILEVLKGSKLRIFSEFRANYNSPGSLNYNKFIDDLKKIKDGKAIITKEYNKWDHISQNDKQLNLHKNQIVMIEGPLAYIPSEEYLVLNKPYDALKVSHKLIGNEKLIDFMVLLKSNLSDRIIRRFNRCKTCPSTEKCFEDTPLSSLMFLEDQESEWIKNLENKIPKESYVLKNDLSREEIQNIFSEKYNQKMLNPKNSYLLDGENGILLHINVAKGDRMEYKFVKGNRSFTASIKSPNLEGILPHIKRYFVEIPGQKRIF